MTEFADKQIGSSKIWLALDLSGLFRGFSIVFFMYSR